jgi:predicted metal-dependent phosphotriesterase family hydrolase
MFIQKGQQYIGTRFIQKISRKGVSDNTIRKMYLTRTRYKWPEG